MVICKILSPLLFYNFDNTWKQMTANDSVKEKRNDWRMTKVIKWIDLKKVYRCFGFRRLNFSNSSKITSGLHRWPKFQGNINGKKLFFAIFFCLINWGCQIILMTKLTKEGAIQKLYLTPWEINFILVDRVFLHKLLKKSKL